MRTRSLTLLAGAAAALIGLALATGPSAAGPPPSTQIAALKRQVATLQRTTRALRATLATRTTQRDSLQTKVGTLTSERDAARAQVTTLTAQVAALTSERDAANGQIVSLASQLANANAALSRAQASAVAGVLTMNLTAIMGSLLPPLNDRFAAAGTDWSGSYYSSDRYRSFSFSCYECNTP